jgi:hypothetical protein
VTECTYWAYATCPCERECADDRPDVATLILDNIDPRRLVSANKRIHHHVRAELCRYWRGLGWTAASEHGETYDRAHITVTFRFPNLIRRDVLNLYPYVVKPLIDGMVTDAGMLPDDDDLHLIGPDLRRDPERGPHRIVVQIEAA